MKFGVFSVSMPEYDIEETAKVLKEIGYDGVEWRVNNAPPAEKPKDYAFETRYWSYNKSTLDINNIEEDAKKAKAVCDRYGLEIYFLTTYLVPGDTESIERVLKAAKSIDCGKVRVFTPGYDEKENYNDLFNRLVDQTKKVEELAKMYGVRVCFEIHMNNFLPSASAAYRFVSHFSPKYIGIIFDPGNMVQEGFENYKMGMDILGEYLAHVHIKNSKWEIVETNPDGTAVWRPSWAPLKKGAADLKKLFSILNEIGYDGYVSLEDFTNEEETYDKLKNNLAYLKEISQK